jgi:hypothetical protein
MAPTNSARKNVRALDALMVATCCVGELDFMMSQDEAVKFAAHSAPCNREDQEAIGALGQNINCLIEAAMRQESAEAAFFADLSDERCYASGVTGKLSPAEENERVMRGRSQLRLFLGE